MQPLLELTSKTLNAQMFGLEFIPHIFCTNFEANFHNMNKLINLPGDIYVYDAIDTASEYTLNKVTLAKSQLKLKIGAEVIRAAESLAWPRGSNFF
jgi:hypothetical protein